MKRGKEYLKWREEVLKRDGYTCVVCGHGKKYLNAHHLIPRNFKQFALCVDNGLTLCPGCHTLAPHSAHKNPIWFVSWMRKHRLGTLQLAEDRLDDL